MALAPDVSFHLDTPGTCPLAGYLEGGVWGPYCEFQKEAKCALLSQAFLFCLLGAWLWTGHKLPLGFSMSSVPQGQIPPREACGAPHFPGLGPGAWPAQTFTIRKLLCHSPSSASSVSDTDMVRLCFCLLLCAFSESVQKSAGENKRAKE